MGCRVAGKFYSYKQLQGNPPSLHTLARESMAWNQHFKELYGFRFAEVKVRMIDYSNEKPFETVLLLDTLTSESPSLSYEESNRLYQEVRKDFLHEKSKYKQLLGVKKSKYFNALMLMEL